MPAYRRMAERSIGVTVDRRLFPRDAVKRAAAALVDRCAVHLDLDEAGAVVATLGLPDGRDEAELRHLAGALGNLLVADLAERRLDPQIRAIRSLLLARALDGALPGRGPGAGPGGGA